MERKPKIGDNVKIDDKYSKTGKYKGKPYTISRLSKYGFMARYNNEAKSEMFIAIRNVKWDSNNDRWVETFTPKKSNMNESYKIHYPSLSKLSSLQYTDPRVNTEGC